MTKTARPRSTSGSGTRRTPARIALLTLASIAALAMGITWYGLWSAPIAAIVTGVAIGLAIAVVVGILTFRLQVRNKS